MVMTARPGGPVTSASPLEQRIAAHYSAGATSILKTAKHFGVSEKAVRDALAACQVPVRPQSHGYRTGPHEAQIIARARRGESARQIGLTLGFHRQTVLTIMRRHGIEPGPKTRPFALTPERAARAAQLYQEGRAVNEVAKIMRCGASAVTAALERSGVERRMKPIPVDQELDRRLVAAYESGKIMREVAEEYGVDEYRVWVAMRRCGVSARPRGSRVAPHIAERAATIVERHRAGQSQKRIAADLGISPSMVGYYLRTRGVTDGSRRGRPPFTPQAARIVQLYAAGCTIKEVSDATGCVALTVANTLKRAGVERRGTGRRSQAVRERAAAALAADAGGAA